MPKGQVALGLRRWLDADLGEQPCASQAACWLDVKRAYMAMRPRLRRIYVVVRDVPTYWPVVEKLGFRPLPDAAVELGGVQYSTVVLDFGPGSVDGWLSSLVGRQLGVDDRELDEDALEVRLRGRQVVRPRWSSDCSGIYASARVGQSVVRSFSVRSGPLILSAAAMWSTSRSARCAESSAPRLRWWRRYGGAATGSEPIGARTRADAKQPPSPPSESLIFRSSTPPSGGLASIATADS